MNQALKTWPRVDGTHELEWFAWPGGYELFGVTDDGGILCAKCVDAHEQLIDYATKGDGWYLIAIDHAGNVDQEEEETRCDHCNRMIGVSEF